MAATMVGVAAFGGTEDVGLAAIGDAAQPTTRVELVDQTTWAAVGGTFDLQVRVTDAPGGAAVQLTIHEQLSSRQAFRESLSGAVGDTVYQSASQPLALDAAGTMRLAVPVGDGGAQLGIDDHGVYPVTVVVTESTGQQLDDLVTYLVLQPDAVYQSDYPPLDVAVIIDVGAPPALRPDGSVSLPPDAQAAIESRVGILDDVAGAPVAVAPVPETLDALVDVGETTRPTLDRLIQATQRREILARPYVDLDLGALATAGMLNQVTPEADAGAQTIRSRLGSNPVAGIWLTGATASAATAGALGQLQIPRAVVPRSALASVPDEIDFAEAVAGPVALGEGGPIAVVADDALAARLLGEDGPLDVQRFVAELAMIWALAPAHARGVVVEVPAEPALDRGMVTAALNSLTEDQSIVRPVTLQDMFTVPPPGAGGEPAVVDLATRTDEAGPADQAGLGEISERLPQAQTDLNGLAGMLDNGGLIRLLQRSLWIAPGSETPDTARPAYVDRVSETESGFAAAISAPTTFRITLTAREGTIPLSIDNTSTQAISVRVELDSSQMEFPGGGTLDLEVPPGGRRVDLDVRLRASGAFPLGVTITSPDGSIVLDRTTFTIRSTAVSGVGLFLSIGAGLFLLIWWARHWRTARRSSRLIQEGPPTHMARHRPVPARRP